MSRKIELPKGFVLNFAFKIKFNFPEYLTMSLDKLILTKRKNGTNSF